MAFRYFRDLFGIPPDDFMMSICNEAMRELSNPGNFGPTWKVYFLTVKMFQEPLVQSFT